MTKEKVTGSKDITVDLPVWMIEKLDTLARNTNVLRNDLIKIWLGEKLDRLPDSYYKED